MLHKRIAKIIEKECWPELLFDRPCKAIRRPSRRSFLLEKGIQECSGSRKRMIRKLNGIAGNGSGMVAKW
jgi:hypothetical protein